MPLLLTHKGMFVEGGTKSNIYDRGVLRKLCWGKMSFMRLVLEISNVLCCYLVKDVDPPTVDQQNTE